MKNSILAVLAALAGISATPVSAQETTIPTAQRLERMCSPDGAMQFGFGQTGVPGSTKLETLVSSGFPLPPAFAPFKMAQPRSTEWSNRFMEMTYSVPLDDEEAAHLHILEMDEALSAAGWEYLDQPINDTPLHLAAYAYDTSIVVMFKTVPETPETASYRILIALDHYAGELTLTCGREDLLALHVREALGDLPDGTPRPVVPEIGVPLIRSEAECSKPEVQAQTSHMLETHNADSFMTAMLSRTNYRDRLSSWMLWKLKSSGAMSSQEIINLSLSVISDASPDGNPFAAMEMIVEIFPIIERLDNAAKSKDQAEFCRAIVPFHEFLAKADAITLKQTEAFQAALAAKADELGVSFD